MMPAKKPVKANRVIMIKAATLNNDPAVQDPGIALDFDLSVAPVINNPLVARRLKQAGNAGYVQGRMPVAQLIMMSKGPSSRATTTRHAIDEPVNTIATANSVAAPAEFEIEVKSSKACGACIIM